MDRHRYFIFNQKGVLVLGILQMACAGLCVVCGFMDAVFRKDTPLSSTRTPVWGGLIMASPGALALFASQRKNSILVSVMVVAAGLSCAAAVFISGYSSLTLTYGEEDKEVFHHHDSPQVAEKETLMMSPVLNTKPALHTHTEVLTKDSCIMGSVLLDPALVELEVRVAGASYLCASSDGEGGQRHHTADLHHQPGSLLSHRLRGLPQSSMLWLL